MKHLFFAAAPLAAAVLLLSACGGGSSSTTETATLTLDSSRLELTAESVDTVAIAVTNQSPSITVRAVSARLPSNWSDVRQDASGCETLAPQASCSLLFTPGVRTYPATEVTIEGENASPLGVSISVASPTSAPLAVENSMLTMTAGEGGQIRVTNRSRSLTAAGVAADFTGTPLALAVEQDASDCANVTPGGSCTLRFQAGSTAVAATSFPIKGSNTNPAGATIEIVAPAAASLSIANSPLVLQAGSATAGYLTITNTSSIFANQIRAQLAGTALDGKVVQDDSQCASLAPGASCQLKFTPASQAVAATSIVVQGSNTAQSTASIAVDAAPPTLSVAGSPLTLVKHGAAKGLTITNTSATATALAVEARLTGTALAGHVTISGNTCGASLAAGASCTISFTPGTTPVSQTSFTIAGTNTSTLTAAMTVRELATGDSFAGGIVVRAPSPTDSGLIVAENAAMAQLWAPDATATPGAQSLDDGAANTAALVAKYGASNDYAAGYCDALTTSVGGQAFSNWYLPALNEALLWSTARLAMPSVFPAAGISFILTSTEHNAGNVKIAESNSTSATAWDGKNSQRSYAGTLCFHAL